ncbi:FAD-dependent oxidoreductase [Methanosarcina horonobensis]|uniref:FAD-dependent oxidoreductase n=1 Tax=Methanosarcina horonobensis TaxID=418008 RepID=UPI0022B8AF18|nr:FAD-dependent oxidoreductase [Methanosarcina horonobensis]
MSGHSLKRWAWKLSQEKLYFYLKISGNKKTILVKDRQFPADLVLLATGVKPETCLAEEAGITIGKAGGIVVNEMLQVKTGEKFLQCVRRGRMC